MLTSQISSHLLVVVSVFPSLRKVVISQPTSVQQFPHLSSIHCLNLLDITIDCNDWQWLAEVENLSEFELSLLGADDMPGSLQVQDNKAVFKSIADIQIVSTLTKITSHLPMKLDSIDALVQGSATQPGSLKISNGEATLISMADNNVIAAFGPILALGCMPLMKVDVSISGNYTKPCRLSLNCERVQLNDITEEETLTAILKVLEILPESVREKVIQIKSRPRSFASNLCHHICNTECFNSRNNN